MFKSVGHFFTSVSQYIVKGAKAVSAAGVKVATTQNTVESLTSLLFPAAVPIEDLAYRLFGDATHAVQSAGDAVAANGVNLTLDAATIAAIRALIPEIEAFAQRIGAVKPVVQGTAKLGAAVDVVKK